MAVPSPEHPLTGACACGAVRLAITAPFESSGYCHCTRCQRRTGGGSSVNARVATEAVAITQGEENLRAWRPEGGKPKWFCVACGGAVFSGDRERDAMLGLRLGMLDGDPGIRPHYRQWLDSAPVWDAIPDDGLERFGGPRPG
jgi:hypothetical protein